MKNYFLYNERMVLMSNKYLQYFTLTIAVVGAINWGLIGFFNFNLVHSCSEA